MFLRTSGRFCKKICKEIFEAIQGRFSEAVHARFAGKNLEELMKDFPYDFRKQTLKNIFELFFWRFFKNKPREFLGESVENFPAESLGGISLEICWRFSEYLPEKFWIKTLKKIFECFLRSFGEISKGISGRFSLCFL